MIKRRLPIVAALALSFTSVTLLAVVLALVLGLRNAADSTETLLRERTANTINTMFASLGGFAFPLLTQSKGIVEPIRAGRLDPNDDVALGSAIAGMLAGTPQIKRVAILHPDCRVDLVERGAPRLEHDAGSSWAGLCPDIGWARGTEGLRWISPHWDARAGQTVMSVEQPLWTPEGFYGLLISSIEVMDLSAFLATTPTGPGQTPFILYGRNAVLARAGGFPAGMTLSPEHPLFRVHEVGDTVLAHLWDDGAEPLKSSEMVPGTSGRRLHLPDGDVSVVYQVRDGGTDEPWIVGTYYRGSLGDAEMARLRMSALLGGALLILVLLLSLWGGRRLSRPVERLALAAGEIETRNLADIAALPGSRVREFDDAASAFNHMVVGLRERQRMRDLFGRYVPTEVVTELLGREGGIEIGGEKRDVTLIFSDIEGFTSLSERLSAETLVTLLNEYFGQIAPLVGAQGGIIVDFIGDAIFAMFGAPVLHADHAARAIACARSIDAFASSFAARQRALGRPFGRTRIGVHTGLATVGNFGSDDRLKYGAMGDVVNTASRLEGANKAFGTTVLVSGETVRQAGEVECRPIAGVVLKGRSAPLDVHELLIGEPPVWAGAYRAAYRLLDGDRSAAEAAFRDLAEIAPADPVIALHRARIAAGERSTVVELHEK